MSLGLVFGTKWNHPEEVSGCKLLKTWWPGKDFISVTTPEQVRESVGKHCGGERAYVDNRLTQTHFGR